MGCVVLLSGGVDSIVCAEMARAAGELRGVVFVDYGHPAQTLEGWKAFAYHGKTGAPLRVVHAFGLHLAEMAGTSADSPRVVPARNLLLIAAAANHAADLGATEVWIGANAADDADYPDCRTAWIDALSAVVRSAYGVTIQAPLAGMTKREIVDRARALGVHQSDTTACYQPHNDGTPCGVCASCRCAGAAWDDNPGVGATPDGRAKEAS